MSKAKDKRVRAVRTKVLRVSKWEAFLQALAKTGSVGRAARSLNMDPSVAYRRARDEEEFAKRMEEAKAQGKEVHLGRLEDEIDRRGVDGWEEPVYQGGQKVGTVRRFSDNLLMFRTKRLDPEYRDRPPDQAINAGNVQIVVGSFFPGQALPGPGPALSIHAPALSAPEREP
jgi:hypothetical protein